MRRLRWSPLWAAICLPPLAGYALCHAQTVATSRSLRVSGQVLSQRDHVPVARARVTLRREVRPDDAPRSEAEEAVLTTDADAQGRFSFEAPTAGWWQLGASAHGFRSQLYNEHEGFSSAVILGSATLADQLTMELEPDSVVSGFVLDEAGEPVREAMVSLLPAAFEPGSAAGQPRRTARTDDRGRYELAGLPPGEYRLSVQATPWYARSAVRGRFASGSLDAAGDAAMDVVYPLTWYPGVLEERSAAEIKLQGGDLRQIDLTLAPLPAAHLRLPAAEPGSGEGLRGQATISRMDGPEPYVSYLQPGAAGEREFGGLAPGLYRVTRGNRSSGTDGSGQATTSFVQVQPGVSRLLTSDAAANTATVTVHLDGDGGSSGAQIRLTDEQTGTSFTEGPGAMPRLRRRPEAALQRQRRISPRAGDEALEVPPGRYLVALAGGEDVFLSSVSLNGVTLAGHEVTLGAGPALLTLTVAHGRAQVTGRAMVGARPVAGAMVMLVPSSFGQPGSTELLARDESNSDGSFEMRGVVPGNYILFAVDRGWQVNWRDPATLNRYLLQGIPISLRPGAKLQQTVRAQAP